MEVSEECLRARNRVKELLSNGSITSNIMKQINTSILELNSSNIPQQTTAKCNVAWNSGSLAYKCRDCQFDSTWYLLVY